MSGYLPHTDADRQTMLKTIGVESVRDLFHDVPEAYRFPELDLPGGLSQMEVAGALEAMSATNSPAAGATCFLGAGAYNHYSPSVVNHTIQRGEFLTAYTPYQPEVSQGTLQAVFEYQSMISALTAMDVSNASHYDGGTSLAEAVILAVNSTRNRDKVVLSPGVHPEYRAVVRTYTQGMGLEIVGDDSPDGLMSLETLAGLADKRTAMLAVQYPDFFGQFEDLTGLAEKAHAAGALLTVVADPVALGLLKPPGLMGADVVVGEGQSLGIPLSFGGPYLGFFATREEYVRKMAGRLVGETVDADGVTGYVLTLATREQHIRRGRATSNICTNEGLMALAASVYLAVMGKHGLRQVAELCYHKAHYAAGVIDGLAGYSVDMGRPFFKEFVVACPRPVPEINAGLWERGIVGGYNLLRAYPARENQMLVAVTEQNTRQAINALVEALGEVAS
jgi:glycine dehydrogenase subunit 1